MAPAHPHATGVAVYPALFKFSQTSVAVISMRKLWIKSAHVYTSCTWHCWHWKRDCVWTRIRCTIESRSWSSKTTRAKSSKTCKSYCYLHCSMYNMSVTRCLCDRFDSTVNIGNYSDISRPVYSWVSPPPRWGGKKSKGLEMGKEINGGKKRKKGNLGKT